MFLRCVPQSSTIRVCFSPGLSGGYIGSFTATYGSFGTGFELLCEFNVFFDFTIYLLHKCVRFRRFISKKLS